MLPHVRIFQSWRRKEVPPELRAGRAIRGVELEVLLSLNLPEVFENGAREIVERLDADPKRGPQLGHLAQRRGVIRDDLDDALELHVATTTATTTTKPVLPGTAAVSVEIETSVFNHVEG